MHPAPTSTSIWSVSKHAILVISRPFSERFLVISGLSERLLVIAVDFKLYTKGQALLPNTLWVVEEIPGLVAGGDQTATLARGYWPSYNVPYYAEVYNRSGYKSIFDEDALAGADKVTMPGYDGGGIEYTIGAPRAKIFRRDEGTVTDLQSFKNILRYANYTDPYAVVDGKVDYGCALCMRGDLGGNGTGGQTAHKQPGNLRSHFLF